MRINQYLANCGITSRRKAEKLILNGLVKVNGNVVTELGTDIKQDDIVEYKGERVILENNKIYLMMNKPKGYLTSVSDDRGRPTVMKLVKNVSERVYPVGRLDFNTEGLLLLTNDGEFANEVMHPSKHISKTYKVTLKTKPKTEHLEQIRKGLVIDGTKTLPAVLTRPKFDDGLYSLEITIFEGRNREIRKLFEAVGYNVFALKRLRIGKLELGELPLKAVRELTKNELLLIFK